MKIACLHTAEVHVATFDALFADAGHGTDVQHVVRSDLLSHARVAGVDAVRAETAVALEALSGADAVLCSCSTLGPLVDGHPNVLRIDRPAMQAAVALGPNVLVAICLDSTRDATLALLAEVAASSGQPIQPRLVLCDAAWPLFEAGEPEAFALAIAQRIREDLGQSARPDSILLAQASMRGAAPLLTDLGVPVLTTPELAVRATLAMARG